VSYDQEAPESRYRVAFATSTEEDIMTEPREVWIETEVGDIGIVGAFGKLGLGLVVRSDVSRKDFNRLAKGIGWPSIKGVQRFDDGPVMVMSRKPRFLWREHAGLSGRSRFQGGELTSG
jgi:hypothetical protein